MLRELPLWNKIFLDMIRIGPVPNHVALILDGNRRYARKRNKEISFGHRLGFENIIYAFKMLVHLGVKHVTVYMFSIENFKRSPSEVESLMALAETMLERFLDTVDQFKRWKICVRHIGDSNLVPRNVLQLLNQLHSMTKDSADLFLNIAFCYTSRNEITQSIRTISKGFQRKLLKLEDIDEKLLTSCAYLQSPKVDLLIRTSGEVRLSDYLLWQSHDAQIIFLQCTWPEFNVWQCLYCILKYQRCCAKHLPAIEAEKENSISSKEQFLRDLKQKLLKSITKASEES